MVSIFETCKPKDAKGLKGILDALEVEATKREDSLDRSNERNKPFNPYAGMFEGI